MCFVLRGLIRAIWPFGTGDSAVSGMADLCRSTSLCLLAIWAEESSSRGLRRWSRLGERCTSEQGASGLQVSRQPIPTLRTCDLVPGFFKWCAGDASRRERGGAWCSDARACIRHDHCNLNMQASTASDHLFAALFSCIA